MTNHKVETLKNLVKQFIDYTGNNSTLSYDKETMNAYNNCLKEISKFEEGERSKKAWESLEMQMDLESPEINNRFSDLRHRTEELNKIAKKLEMHILAMVEEFESQEYNINTTKNKMQMVLKICEHIEEKAQSVDSTYPLLFREDGPSNMVRTFWSLRKLKSECEDGLKSLEGVILGTHHKNTVKSSLEHMARFLNKSQKDHEEVIEVIENMRDYFTKRYHAGAIELIQEIKSGI